MNGRTIATCWLSWVAVAFLFLRVGPTPLAVGADDRIEIVPHWEKGARASYEITKTRTKEKEGSDALNATSRTDLVIEVLDKTAEGYSVAWTFGETTFLDPEQQRNPLIKQMANLIKGQRIVLDLDVFAAIKGVRNWEELRAASTKVIDGTAKELAAAGVDPTVTEKVRGQAVAMFSTQKQIEQTCIPEARIFFMAHGATLSPSEPLEYEDHLQSPFGGEALPTHARFSLRSMDRASDQVIITWEQSVDPEQLQRVIEGIASSVAKDNFSKLKNMSMEDHAEFVLEMSTGWVRSLRHTRRISLEGGFQQDDVTIVRKQSE